MMPEQDLKIEPFYDDESLLPYIDGFTVTTPDGIIYTFDRKEYSLMVVQGPVACLDWELLFPDEYAPTAWHLSRIYNPNTLDQILLLYEDIFYCYDQSRSESFVFNNLLNQPGNCNGIPNDVCKTINGKFDQAVQLKYIVGNYNLIEFHTVKDEPRKDIQEFTIPDQPFSSHRLSEITIRGKQELLLKSYSFTQEWIETPGYFPGDGISDYWQFRMYLTQVQEFGDNPGAAKPPYQFEYHNRELLPTRLSYNRDHWGYYNGADNDNLIPPSLYNVIVGGLDLYTGADRETNTDFADCGLLKKITYPYSGFTKFEYEGHQYTSNEGVPEMESIHQSAHAIQDCDYVQDPTCEIVTDVSEEFTLINPQNVLLYRRLTKLIDGSNGPLGEGPNCGIEKFNEGSGGWDPVNLEGEFEFVLQDDGITLMAELWNGEYQIYPISLSTGTYRLWAESEISISSALIHLWCDSETGNIIYPIEKAGGARISEITNSSSSSDPDVTRQYEYEPFYFTGVQHMIYDRLEKYRFISGGYLVECSRVVLTSNPITGSSPGSHVAYYRVNEVFPDNGRIRYDFTQLTNGTPNQNNHPLSPVMATRWADYSWRRGLLLRKTVFDEDENTLYDEINTYNDFASSVEVTYGLNVIEKLYDNTYPPAGGENINFAYEHYALYSAPNLLEQKVAATYDQNGENPITTTTTYTYGSDHINPLQISSSGGGVSQNTSITYPHEAEVVDHPHASEMVARNMVSIPLETTVTGTVESGYRTIFTLEDDMILPYMFEQQLGSSEWQTIGVFGYGADENEGHYTPFPNNYAKPGFLLFEEYFWYPHYSPKRGLLQKKKYGDWEQTFDYDPNSRLMTSQTSIDGQEVTYGYDDFQRLQTITERNGQVVTTNSYQIGNGTNSISSVTTFTDGTSQQTNEQLFDGLGRMTHAYKNGILQKGIEYDNTGRIGSETYMPGSDIMTSYTYEPSPLNRVQIETYPDQSTVQYGFFTDQNLFKESITDENGNTSFVFTNRLGQQKETQML